MEDLRQIVCVVDGKWVETRMSQLKIMDVFKFVDDAETIWQVAFPPYKCVNEHGVETWAVQADDVSAGRALIHEHE